MAQIFPILAWIKKYDRNKLFLDFVAGATLAAVSIPLGIAYARNQELN
jgi:MFS superfamily sulfate permease-like transporter